MKLPPAASLAVVFAIGCSGAAPTRAQNVLEASRELGHVWASPQADLAPSELAEAEAALALAEHEAPGWDADDDAYVARRMAQRAHLAVLYEAERETLVHARGAVRRLDEIAVRRRAFFEELARHRKAEAEARARLSAARHAAFERVRKAEPRAQILERPEGLLLRMPVEAIFLPGTSLLRAGGEERLAALATALRRGAGCDVRVQVIDTFEGIHVDAAVLASRRVQRVRDTLRAHGLPDDAFVAPLRRAPYDTQVDVLVVERPAS